LEAADRHERAVVTHERARKWWATQGDDERTTLQRELAVHERRGAKLERRWAALVERRAATSD